MGIIIKKKLKGKKGIPKHSEFYKFSSEYHVCKNKRAILRKYWEIVFPFRDFPIGYSEDTVFTYISYTYTIQDYKKQGIPIPKNVLRRWKKVKLIMNRTTQGGKIMVKTKKGKKKQIATKKKALNKKAAGRKPESGDTIQSVVGKIFKENNTKKLSDQQICDVMAKKFGKEFNTKLIAYYRYQYNKGKLKGQLPFGNPPKTPAVPYNERQTKKKAVSDKPVQKKKGLKLAKKKTTTNKKSAKKK